MESLSVLLLIYYGGHYVGYYEGHNAMVDGFWLGMSMVWKKRKN